jgi:hypothetical protein
MHAHRAVEGQLPGRGAEVAPPRQQWGAEGARRLRSPRGPVAAAAVRAGAGRSAGGGWSSRSSADEALRARRAPSWRPPRRRRRLAGALASGPPAKNAPLAVRATKKVIVSSGQWSAAEEWDRQGELIAHIFTSADAIEGAQAFAEKRPPNWQGR